MKETKKRSFTKTITWRVVAILSTLIVISFFSKNIAQNIFITTLLNVNAVILYYIHERIWNLIKWERR